MGYFCVLELSSKNLHLICVLVLRVFSRIKLLMQHFTCEKIYREKQITQLSFEHDSKMLGVAILRRISKKDEIFQTLFEFLK